MSTTASAPASVTGRQWALLITLCGTAFSVVLDSATVVTALPSIRSELGFSAAGLHWVVTAYSLTFGGLMILGGRLADLLGTRRVFLTGLAAFAVASLACGLAWSPEALVTSRFAQGAAGAVIMPAALSIVMKTFAEGPVRNKALAVWSSVAGSGGILGLVIGGPLTDGPGWQWIFLMNVPIAVAVWFPSLRLIDRDDRVRARGTFDLAGALTVTAGLMLLVWTVTEIPEKGAGHRDTLLGLAGVLVLAAAFTVAELRSRSPIVPFRIFTNPFLTSGNIALFLIGFGSQGMWFVMSIHLQGVHGFSATGFAAIVVVSGAASFAGIAIGNRLLKRLSLRSVIAGSVLGAGVSIMFMLGISADDATVPLLAVAGGLAGLAGGVASVSCSIAALTGVEEADHGIASSLEESTFMIGGPLGIAAAATVTAWISAGSPESMTAAQAATAGHQWAIGILGGALMLCPLLTSPLMRKRRLDSAPSA